MKPNRRHLLQTGLAGMSMSALATPLATALATTVPSRVLAQTKQSKKFRIFMILFRGPTDVEKGFLDYLQLRNIDVEYIVRDVAQDISKVAGFIDEAKALQVDLIYTWGTPVTLAVAGKYNAIDRQRHVTDIPIVFTMVASPLGSGLVASRTTSERNLTGTSHVVPIDQQLGAMRAYRPLDRLAVMFNPDEPNAVLTVKDLRAAAQRDHFVLIEKPIPVDAKNKPLASALPQLIETIARLKPQFLYAGPDSFIGANRTLITETALRHQLPVFSATEVLLREGKALFGLVSRYYNVGQLTAFKVEQILVRHARAQDIPIDTLARFSYIVNMSVAKELQFYPPLKVVNYAEII